MNFSTRDEQKRILNEWAALFGYEIKDFDYKPSVLPHDFEAMVIYEFMDRTSKDKKECARTIASALYMAKHGLKDTKDLPWK